MTGSRTRREEQDMTFSIIGRCPETGQLGIAISSSSIAVGARCPWVRAGIGAVATQNVTLPALGPQILDLLADGRHDPRAALFSGKEALGLYNAVAGDHCVAAGNMLASLDVIAAMVPTFEHAQGMLA